MSDEAPKKEEAKPPEDKRKDIFTGLLVVAGVLVVLVLATMAVAGVESYVGDGYGGSGSGPGRAQAFKEAADMIAEVEDHIDRVIDTERTGEAVRRVDPGCVDPASRFTAAVLAKIRVRLERKAKRASDESAETRRRSCRRSDNRCGRRGDEDYPEALK